MNANLTAPATTDAAQVVVELTDGKRPCSCSDGCPGLTTRFFSQGHDARMVTRLRNAVAAGELSLQDAFAEVVKRGGTERLQIKLDAAVANAAKPRKKSKKAAKSTPIETFDLDGFTLASMPLKSEPNQAAKVGRWEYRGSVDTYQIIEDGKVSKGDTVLVFEYKDKKGDTRLTTTYTRIKDEDFDAPADEAQAEVPERKLAVEADEKAEPTELLPVEIPAALAGVIGPRRVTNSGDPIPF